MGENICNIHISQKNSMQNNKPQNSIRTPIDQLNNGQLKTSEQTLHKRKSINTWKDGQHPNSPGRYTLKPQ